MHSYLNVHLALEQIRESISKVPGQSGPRVLIVGPQECGKDSLSKILLNYSVKQSRTPLFVDIDTNLVCIYEMYRVDYVVGFYRITRIFGFHCDFKTN